MEQDTPAPGELNPAESTRTRTRPSARTPIIEVISRSEPRRRWSPEQKQAIAAESLMPGVSPDGGRASLRHQQWAAVCMAQSAAAGATRPALAAGFARVEVTDHDRSAAAALPTLAPPATDLIEITLPDGTLLRVPTRLDRRILRGLLGALRR